MSNSQNDEKELKRRTRKLAEAYVKFVFCEETDYWRLENGIERAKDRLQKSPKNR